MLWGSWSRRRDKSCFDIFIFRIMRHGEFQKPLFPWLASVVAIIFANLSSRIAIMFDFAEELKLGLEEIV